VAKKPSGSKPPAEEPLVSFSGEADAFGRPIREEEEPKKAYVDASDEAQIQARKKEEGQRRRADRDFYQLMMSTPARRDSFYRLLERCHIYGTVADLGTVERPSDALRTYFQSGEENVGKQLMTAAMDASLDLYLRMLKEQKEAKDAKERADE
jgi:hypothetical protein